MMRYLAVVLVMVAGCTTVTSEPVETSTSQGIVDTTSGASVASTTTSTSQPETIADFFGYVIDPDQLQEATIRVEEAIRLCMAHAGFDYSPIIPPDVPAVPSEPPEQAEPIFGIAALLDVTGEVADWVDPNQETVEAMSEAEREEWFRTLYGAGEDDHLGCMAESQRNDPVLGGPGRLPDELEAELAAMNQRVSSDDRVVEAEQEWSHCLGEEGFAFFSVETFYDEAEAHFAPRFDSIVPPVTYFGDAENGWQEQAFGDPFPGWTEIEVATFLDESTPAEIAAHFEEARDEALAQVDEEALIAVQRERHELEEVHQRCVSDYHEVRDEVQREYEAEFVSVNREALERVRDDS